jgi:hypothetical protein
LAINPFNTLSIVSIRYPANNHSQVPGKGGRLVPGRSHLKYKTEAPALTVTYTKTIINISGNRGW